MHTYYIYTLDTIAFISSNHYVHMYRANMYYKDMYICNMHQALSLTKHVQLCSMWTLTSSLHWVSKGHKHSKFNLLLITRHFEETTTGDLLLVNLVGYTQISGVIDVLYSMIIYAIKYTRVCTYIHMCISFHYICYCSSYCV